MKKIYILGAMVCGLAACKPNVEPKAPERGDADFSVYLAVGSGHTAGYTNGSYYLEGQRNSFPVMLAKQMEAVGSGEFKQPLVPGQHGWPVGKFILDHVQGPCDTIATIQRTMFKGALDTVGTSTNIAFKGPFNNMGIPFSKVTDYTMKGFGLNNIYANRMFGAPATSTPLSEMLNVQHTFFTLWLGMDDVLDYARAGGDYLADPGSAPELTNTNEFSVAYDSVINTVTRNGAKGVVLTIPDILDMPFFRAVSPRSLELNAKDANKLNLQYNGTQVHFDVGMNYYVIEDKSMAGGVRQLQDGEIVLLDMPMDSVKCKGWGSTMPVPARYVLTNDEIKKIEAAVDAYNGIILKLADNYNVAVADTRYFLKNVLSDGGHYNGADYTFKYYEGGLFSLDGIYLTGRGNALLANNIIHAINKYYKSSIADVDVNAYSATKLP